MHKNIKEATNRGLTRKILLTFLSSIAEATLEVIDEGFLNPNYAFTHPLRALLGFNYKGQQPKLTDRSIKLRRNLFATTLRRLQSDGLVEKSGSYRRATWRITALGRKQAANLRVTMRGRFTELPLPDGKIRVVSFDIPEKERWKRDRLRAILVSCKYEMLQRSLWTGRRPLPEFVFREIKNLKLRHYVHIFEINKKGTTQSLV